VQLGRELDEPVAAIVEPTELFEDPHTVRDDERGIDARLREARRDVELCRMVERREGRARHEAVIEHRDRELQGVGDVALVELAAREAGDAVLEEPVRIALRRACELREQHEPVG
jgi:hypothetical protein